MIQKQKFEVGNQVRVKTYGGGVSDTIYEIVELFPNDHCMIREYSSTVEYKAQPFYTSMLAHAVTDEMLKAFSLGKLKAGRRTT